VECKLGRRISCIIEDDRSIYGSKLGSGNLRSTVALRVTRSSPERGEARTPAPTEHVVECYGDVVE
jgi:hypothetical protein